MNKIIDGGSGLLIGTILSKLTCEVLWWILRSLTFNNFGWLMLITTYPYKCFVTGINLL